MTVRIGWLVPVILLLAGCAQQVGQPPVVDRTSSGSSGGGTGYGASEAPAPLAQGQPLLDSTTPDAHVVQPGDTLYGIAWRYGLDYRTVARANGIEAPYRIQVGQRLRLAGPAGTGPAPGQSGSQGPVSVAGTSPAMVPAEPSSRGFEYIPDAPADGQQEVWQDVPPPAPAAGAPSGVATTAPGTPPAAFPAPGAPSGVPSGMPTTPPPPIAPAPEPFGVPPGGLPGAETPVASLPPPVPAQVPDPVAAAPAVSAPVPAEVAVAPPASVEPPAPAATPPLRSTPAAVGTWRWPTSGSVQKGFGNGNKGIDFRLDPGQPVIAAGGGEVVYAGNGLGGFRHLVIVKHDQRFLSAYSLNRPIAVKEGERIESGGMIAGADAAGASGAGTLRFEIRRDGQPVDPVSVIGR